jgi:hypothetical protein
VRLRKCACAYPKKGMVDDLYAENSTAPTPQWFEPEVIRELMDSCLASPATDDGSKTGSLFDISKGRDARGIDALPALRHSGSAVRPGGVSRSSRRFYHSG